MKQRWILLAGLLFAHSKVAACEVDPDEQVEFFSTLGFRDAASYTWQADVHGWIYKPEQDSKRRKLLLASLRKALDLDDDPKSIPIFDRRARLFLVDNRQKQLSVQVAGLAYPLQRTDSAGHVRESISVSNVSANQWLPYEISGCKSGKQSVGGRIWLAGDQGVAIISDIDDTVKVSNVGERRKLLRKTFLEPYEAVPGMAALYQKWSNEYGGTFFYYLSASPWQLYGELTAFLRQEGFPDGVVQLKRFRWKDQTFLSLFENPETYKKPVLEALFKSFPYRRFILVGDSGEKDPEIYGALAREFPAQIQKIYIRSISTTDTSERWKQAFKDVPADRWQVFRNADDVLKENS